MFQLIAAALLIYGLWNEEFPKWEGAIYGILIVGSLAAFFVSKAWGSWSSIFGILLIIVLLFRCGLANALVRP